MVRYRCHGGHAFSDEAMLSAPAARLESPLWSAIRTLKEKAELARRLSSRIEARGLRRLAHRSGKAAAVAEHGAEVIWEVLLSGSADDSGDVAEDEPAEAERALSRTVRGKGSR
ncbi:MAG TPA: hypothetical protein VH763_03025 [Gemmatimonadales bacterium]